MPSWVKVTCPSEASARSAAGRPNGARGADCGLLKATSGNGSLAAAAGGEAKVTGTSGHREALARPSALMTSSSSARKGSGSHPAPPGPRSSPRPLPSAEQEVSRGLKPAHHRSSLPNLCGASAWTGRAPAPVLPATFSFLAHTLSCSLLPVVTRPKIIFLSNPVPPYSVRYKPLNIALCPSSFGKYSTHFCSCVFAHPALLLENAPLPSQLPRLHPSTWYRFSKASSSDTSFSGFI